MTDGIKLTDKQKEMVAQNHDLIYSYAHQNNLALDEYYDVLAIGLCNAAKAFDEDKGTFSTIAYTCMKNEVSRYWRSRLKKSSVPDEYVVSYDCQNTNDDGFDGRAFLESFSDYESYNDMMYSIISEDFGSKLTDKEAFIYKLLLNGVSQVEIADRVGLKNTTINYYVNQIRNKLINYLGYN